MKMNFKRLSWDYLCLGVLAFGAWTAAAQTDPTNFVTTDNMSLDDLFHGGRHEVTLGAGAEFSPFIAIKIRPTVDYALADAQYGFMVSDVKGQGVFRGNVELAPELFGAGIWQNTGHYIAGGTLWFRYNFVQPTARLIPYFQVGGGWTFMDIDHRYDGENYNFNVDGSAGMRYFIKPTISLNIEYRFQHISNADLWKHNIGLNSEGPVIGISWLL